MADLLASIRTAWGWRGLDPIELVARNAFGNVIVRDAADQHWRIMPEELSADVVAASAADYRRLAEDPDFQEDWAMQRLVEAAEAKLGPADEKSFYLVTPAVLGGAYDADNFQLISLDELLRLSGDLAQQIAELPDGAQVRLNVSG